jgi:YihY family inner membrane protein
MEPNRLRAVLRGTAEGLRRVVAGADRLTRRHPSLAVPVAVAKKFGDDGGGRWAALAAYYGFLSLFPLLLVLTTLLGFVVQGNQELQDRILDSALSQFPIIGDEIRANLGALRGSGVALAVGLIGSVWAGMGVVLTLQDAMNALWNVPRTDRPSFFKGRLRAVVALATLGLAVLATAGLSSLGTIFGPFGWSRMLGVLGTLALNALVFGAAFRYLTVAPVEWRQVLPGAATAAVAWMALLAAGSWLVDRQLRHASTLYGFFAIVLGLMWWMYLAAQIALLSAELNVVLARRLWPRSPTGAGGPPGSPAPGPAPRP